jgi:(4-O-methyl)-D-glucuronate---lignin esterase
MTRPIARSLVGLAAICVTGAIIAPALRSQGSLPPHVQLTRDEDFARERAMIGLAGPPPAGASNASPATFDESKANPYPALPDPLRLNNGQRVTTAAMWNTRRRAELIELFEREVYGRTPKVTPKVTWEVLSTTRETNGDVPVITKQLVGHVDNSSYPTLTVNILASVSTPANATGPVPVILSLSAPGFGGPTGQMPDGRPGPALTTVCQPPNAAPPPAAAARAGGAGRAGAPGTAGRAGARGPAAPQGPTNQQQALARGWGYASVNTGSVQADNGQGLTCGIIGLVNKGQPRTAEDWGVLAAWGWGASRVLDYFETDPAVDASRVGLYGHSRWGKATLLATVLDPRFAIAYVSSSGQGGAKLYRRKYGETVDNVADTFYYWMGANFMKYAGHWDALPVDSHELIALMAPRPVFFSGGNEVEKNPDGSIATRVNDQGQTVVAQAYDAWVDPRGNFMAAVAAGPVYELLGKHGLGITAFPPLDTKVITGDIGFHEHALGHTSGPAWETFYTFASRYLSKK